MKRNKVVIIGIDGLDPVLVDTWIDYLPHLKKIKEQAFVSSIESTFPPDSICAWSSIFTGQSPAQHGLLEGIDYLSKKEYKYSEGYDFSKDSFWDVVSNSGKKVCIINPFLAYPAWELNGIMISGPVFEHGETTFYPPDLADSVELPPLGGWVDFPSERNLKEFIKKARLNTELLARAAIDIYRRNPSDLFFITFLTLDRVEHFLWRFMDKQDFTYPGDNPYKDAIKDFYILLDKIIGDFINYLKKDSYLIIISDHGHRRRSSRLLNVNEFLRRKGYLATSVSGISGKGKKIIEKTKSIILRKVSKFGCLDFAFKLAKLIPNKQSFKKGTYLINTNESLACAWELCGTNSFGGIEIKKKGEDYEKMRTKIMDELKGLDACLQGKIFNWVKKKEELYAGEYLSKYPDIVFELTEDYGTGWGLFGPLVEENHTHRKISGGHSGQGVLAVLPAVDSEIRIPASIIEIKNFILGLINR